MAELLREQLATAIEIAVEAHRGRWDKIGMPYILHPLAVMESLPVGELSARIVAVLHDVLEDTNVGVGDLLRRGIQARLCLAVEDITHRPGEELSVYYARVKLNPLALRVKFADIRNNTSDCRMKCLLLADRIRLQQKYRLALIALGLEEVTWI